MRCRAAFLLPVTLLYAAEYRAPAGSRPAIRRPGGESILPGGRMIAPLGRQTATGPGPWGLAVSPSGKRIVSADGGPNRYSLTFLEQRREGWRTTKIDAKKDVPADGDDDFRSVFMGVAFDGEDQVYASEGNSGRVRLLEVPGGKRKQIYELNSGGYQDSYSGDLAYDRERGLLYVVDQANFRVVTIDTRKHRIAASTPVGRLPFAIALSPDGRRVYVTNIGMFRYSAIPGADPANARETGLPFPPFGFPSKDAAEGAERMTPHGPVQVPGLGDPNVKEANSLTVLDVAKPEAPRVLKFVPTGIPVGQGSVGGSSPSGIAATASHIYVANGNNDSITVVNAASLEVEKQIELRIPGLETYRGILPTSLTAEGNWLLIAEAGINAIGVIDTRTGKLAGHLPAGWFPTRVLLRDGLVYAANAKGNGTGPNASMMRPFERSFQSDLRHGSLSLYPFPDPADFAKHTARVVELNGFQPARQASQPLPKEIRYVVMIVKENRTFDEVFGDIVSASNGPVNSAWDLARYGRYAVVSSERGELAQRFGLKNVAVTPNHHAIAERFAFGDNFYADSEVSVDGHHWLVGSYPNAWTESTLMAAYGGQKNFRLPTTAPGRLLFAGSNSSVHPEEQLEAGAIWHHLERNGISFRNFGEGFELAGADEGVGLKPTGARYLTNMPMPDPLYRNTSREYPNYNMNIPDQFRATQFIAEVRKLYIDGTAEFPRFLFIHLPNDHTAKARPEDGYPFVASYVADNDFALGRIVEFLSHSPWWKQMAIFITEDDAQGGVDHVDSHRTVMMLASPYARKGFVTKVNSSFPGMLKTVFSLLNIPPLNLYDAAASNLAECFTSEPDFTPFNVQSIRPELFDPAKAREPMDPKPGPRMDDPRVLRKQHNPQP